MHFAIKAVVPKAFHLKAMIKLTNVKAKRKPLSWYSLVGSPMTTMAFRWKSCEAKRSKKFFLSLASRKRGERENGMSKTGAKRSKVLVS